jgi:hypothetical protein
MVALMIAMLRLVPAAWMAGALVIGLAVGWHLMQTRAAYNAGWDAALATVEKMDARARSAAQDARNAVDRCFDEGGTWDAISASCRL